MQKELIHENKLGSTWNKVFYNKSKKTIWLESEGIFFDTLALEANRKVMDFATTNEVENVIFDSTKLKGTFSKITGFFKDEYAPHMEKHGTKRIAVAFSGNTIAIFAMQQLLKILKTQVQIKIFKTMPEAEKWIMEKLN